ncbi:hypothetical protein LLE49_24145 [Alicyclobacillus tolerans]|uniref:HEPN domain-containing protein n=1 Tax=Alicyclobacillus tolerans TaxID=90970 RepID=UPI001F320AC2|nr:HEPN domain-containing protein [Alicyclobacillus tolerans]MCF8567816.1 hypothetical protein [Alicyclobacillus tolerans]
MTATPPHTKYGSLFDTLSALIEQANTRVIQDEPDPYIYDNVNFFIKSFLVVSCVYLESYLKEVGELIVNSVQQSLRTYPVPHNLVKWSVDDNKDKVYKFSAFELEISKDNIDDVVSGNVGKTINFFKKLGLDVASDPGFQANKDVVASIVQKRNDVVHHNDDANDVSLPDLLGYVRTLKAYVESIDKMVVNSGLLRSLSTTS